MNSTINNPIKQLMLDLIKKGIRFTLNGDKVKLEGDLSNLSNEIKAQLRQHKEQIVALVKASQQSQLGQNQFKLEKAPLDQAVPLSYAQQRLWFIDQLEQGSPEYNMPLALELTGALDSQQLSRAIETLQQRHDVLASRFVEDQQGVWLEPDPNSKIKVGYTDLSHKTDSWQQFSQLAANDAQTPFNLTQPPFFRAHIVKLDGQHHGLLLNFHHIVTDGWSEQLLIDEIFSLYHAFSQHQNKDQDNDKAQAEPLPPLDWQYRDYAWSQRQWLKGDNLDASLDYWRKRLAGLPQMHSLNLDTPKRTRPAQQTFNGNHLSTQLDLASSEQLNQLCRQHDVTLFMLLETAFALLMARTSGENDIAIGTPVSGRVVEAIEPVVGCFLNTLVLRNQLDLDQSFSQTLANNKQHILADFEHQTLPFELLVESINPERSLSHAPLFQLFFTVNQNSAHSAITSDHSATTSAHQQLDIKPVSQPVTSTKFDLSLVANSQKNQGLQLSWTYNTDLFSLETISLFAQRFEVLLKAIIAAPDSRLSQLNYLAPSEQQLLQQFGQGKTLTPASNSRSHNNITHWNIAHWFEQQVKLTPDAIAVAANSNHLSYHQLNQRANLIAQGLIDQGVKPNDLVAVLLERNCDLVATLLAIFKVGAGYVPVDPKYPLARCQLILDDAKVKLVVSTEKQSQWLNRSDFTYLLLDNLNNETLVDNPNLTLSDSSIAYVIYTSGSTGKPKGVAISQQNALALLNWALDFYQPQDLSKVAATTSVCFDLSIFELFVPLVSGNQVVMLDNGLAIDAHSDVSLINTVPSVMQALVSENALPSTIKVINLAGEALKRALVDDIFAAKPQVKLFNLYGPSEDTTYSTVAAMAANQDDIPAIGQPIAGTQASVLDSNGKPVGIGITGELYLSGAGVAQCYLHQPQLTAEKFTTLGYRTGDLVRFRHDGNLDYIGRADRQVKLRGFRIELGEIEAIISQQQMVGSAAVKVVNDSLIAWVATDNSEASVDNSAEQQQSQLQQQVAQQLPSHMQPTQWILLDSLPTTSNGKVDYNALPIPALDNQTTKTMPRNKVETTLYAIWQGLLGHDNFGIEDNFFSIGGDSILSIQVVSRAKAQGLHFSVRQLFEAQTIAQLANVCQTKQQLVIPQQSLNGELALLPIQQDFFTQQLANPHHYNQAVLLNTPKGLTQARLTEMLLAIIERHDALRLTFAHGLDHGLDHEVNQGQFAPSTFKLAIEQSTDITASCSRHQASLNYQTGPLFKAVYFNHDQDEPRLLLLAHHLIIDGVSWRIILNDLAMLMAQKTLAAKTHSIRDWQQALVDYVPQATEQLDYWHTQWQQNHKIFSDKFSQSQEPQQLDSHSLHLSESLTTQLLRRSNTAYRNEVPEILLASLLHAWQQFTDHQTLVIALEGHGREPEVLNRQQPLDLTETVGWFTTLYPLALSTSTNATNTKATSTNATQSQRIRQVKETIRQVPDKGLGYGVLRYLAKQPELISAENYQHTLVFNYLGQFDVDASNDNANANTDNSFTPANEAMGPFSSPANGLRHLMALNGMVSGGQLQFAISFDKNRLNPQQVEQFAQLWQSALESDILHASDAKNCHLTPIDFPLATMDSEHLDKWQLAYPQISNLYPATPMQQGLMFHGLYEGQQHSAQAYTTQTYFDIDGPLDPQAFEQAWQAVIEQHDILRTAFVGQTLGQIHQLVVEQLPLSIQLHDWRQQQPQSLAQFRDKDKAKGFDFAKPPLMRLSLIRLEQQRWHFVWSHHHVLLDGWCLPIVFNQVMQCYRQLAQKQPIQLPTVTPYVEYIKWLTEQDQNQAKAFWQQQLADFYQNQPIEKTFAALADFNQKPIKLTVEQADYHAQQLTLTLQLTAQLQQLIEQGNTTLNLILQAAWASLVARFSGEQHLMFGTTVSGRPAELVGVENMVGLFINTLPVAIHFEPNQTLGECLNQLANDNINRQAHGFLSLGDIASQSNMAAAELFDTLVVVENFPVTTSNKNKDKDTPSSADAITIGDIGSDEHTNYPLTLICHQREHISINFGYQPDKFADGTIARLMELLTQTLTQMTPAALNQPLADLRPITSAEQQQLQHWGAAKQQFEVDYCIHHQFEQQVARAPQSIALTCSINGENQHISYSALNAKANQLAHYLIAQGVGPETVVGLHFDAGMNLMVAMLAILKAGGAYLPLVPELPQERIEHMLKDCDVNLVLSQEHLAANIRVNTGISILCLDQATTAALLSDYSEANPDIRLSPNQLAYIIYTSGSTGLPKGVRIEHRNIVRLLKACELDFGQFRQDDVWTLFHGYGFDFSVWEIWGALGYGGRLVCVTKALTREPQAFAQLLQAQKVTVLNQTPSAFYPLIEQLSDLHALRLVIFGGEALNYSLLQPWYQLPLAKSCQLVNMYGITETCVHATYRQVSSDDCHHNQPSTIGRALADLSFRVCDPTGALQVLGAPGELWISGGGVARDYLNRPELTAQKFVEIDNQRYYRSGDSVRWCSNGELDYLGRIDQQVKIRGFRIELGEIEAKLSQIESVDNVAVLARNDNNNDKPTQLVAYLAIKSPEVLDQANIKQQLAKDLPPYMVPELYVQLEQLPLTVNGKIDRKALPKPTESDLTKAEHIAAKNPLQQQLIDIWQQVLGLEKIGIKDNFFSLGGDSIIAIQVVARARQQGLSMSVRQLFEQPTIDSLAADISATDDNQTAAIDYEKAQGNMPLLPIHHDFFAQQLAVPQHFNQALLLNTPPTLTAEKLQQMVDLLLERHDSLRLVFKPDQAIYQTSKPQIVFLQQSYSEQACQQIQTQFDLSQGPLVKFVWFEQDHKLLICMHHLIVDGVSWRILLQDIETAFNSNSLPSRPIPMHHWGVALQRYANSERVAQQRAFWQAQTLNHELFQSPPDASRGELKALSMQLSTAQTKALLGPVHQTYNTRINDLLLAALASASGKVAQGQILIELESHGREAIDDELFADIDISETIGWFTAVYPLLLQAQDNWADTIITTKEKLRKVPDAGIGYGALRYLADDKIQPQNSSTHSAGLLFNYLGQFDNQVNQHNAFSMADEAIGAVSDKRNLPSHRLTLNGMVEGGKLGFNLNYDSGLISRAQAQQLLDSYQQALVDCIEHCQNAQPQSTPSDYKDADISLEQLRRWQQQYSDIKALYLATPMQTGLLFHGMLDNEDLDQLCGSDYSTQTILTLTGSINSDNLRKAWQQVLDRHDILRTAFVGIGEGAIHQLVERKLTLPFDVLDWREKADFEQQLADFISADKARGFDFATPPLLRITLIKQSNSQSHLIWTHHHSLLDGWCLPLLFKEVGAFYDACQQNSTANLAQVPPYQDYIAWLNRQNKAKAKTFWQQQLADFDSPIDISIKKPVADSQLGDYHRQHLSLKPQLSEQLNQLARELQVTQSTLVQAAWGLLLSHYGNSDDVVFGVTVSGRPPELAGIEQMVGLFINTIPVRIQLKQQQSLAELLKPLQQNNLTRENYSFLSLADIQNQAAVSGGTALFDSLVIFENYPVDEALSSDKTDDKADNFVISSAHSKEQTNYGLTLMAHQAGDNLLFNLGYYQGQFEQHSIVRLLNQLETILGQFSADTMVKDISPLSQAEQQQLKQWAKSQTSSNSYVSIIERFEQQAAATPDSIAVSCQGQHISYAELALAVNNLAAKIQHIEPQADVIGIYLPRNMTMITAMLAVLKAGYAYLPLDMSYPKARLLEMATDSQLDCLIGDEVLATHIHTIDAANVTNGNQSPESMVLADSSPAYRIYTSGSTGKPKGVTLSHGNVAALLDWAQQFYRFDQLKVVAATTPISFDISVFEIFAPLSVGGRIALMENALNLDDDSITLLNTVPSVLKAAMQEQQLPTSLKAINLAGEPLPQSLVDSIAANIPVYNLYGPSEDTVYSIGCRVLPQQHTPPIGKPVAGSNAYVLDRHQRPVSIGVPGELYLSGLGVGLGYHNRPELNEKMFIRHPLNVNERCYKTGDLVRWRQDGQLEYIGRIDNQVKLRGLRIELGEVETRLNQITQNADVSQSQHTIANRENVVLVNNNQLIAFTTAKQSDQREQNEQSDISSIKQQLQSTLPAHMVPDRFIVIEQIPLNANGKIDRKQLLNQLYNLDNGSNSDSNANAQRAAAQSATESTLITIWQGLLNSEHIGTNDDFFALGGDSIIAIQVVTRARRQGLSLTVRAIFEHSTVANLAAFIDNNTAVHHNNAEQSQLTGSVQLLPIQHDFFAQQLARPNHYNQTMLLTTPVEMSQQQCETLIRALVNRHDSLRLQFDPESVGYYQAYDARMFEYVSVEQIERESLTASCEQYQRSLDVNTGPLFKAVYFKPNGQSNMQHGRLLIAIHHLVVDGVSWRIILDDLRTGWQALKQAKPLQLGDKTHSTKSWQQAISALDLSEQLSYWQTQLQQQPLAFCQTADANEPQPACHVEGLTLSLDQTSTSALLADSHIPYRTTIEELLLAALFKAGVQWSGLTATHAQLTVELESHGRETEIVDHQLDLSETVGWFTALYPLKLKSNSLDWPQIIRSVKTSYRAIPNKGIGFGILKHLHGQSLPQPYRGILFNYVGQLDSLTKATGDITKAEDVFVQAPEPAGMPVSHRNRPANPLTINAHISEGCLQVALHSDSSVLAPQKAAQFADCYRQALYQCIEHCLNAKTSLSLADFSNAKVDEATLQLWLQQFPQLDKLYPATPMQQGILFHCLLDENRDSDIYTTQSFGDMRGPLHVEAFKQAWQQLLNHHDVLRTSFVGLAMDTIHQLVQTDLLLPFTFIDMREQSIDHHWLKTWRAQDKAKGFAIENGQMIKGPLMRVAVIRLTDDRWHFVWTYHHVLLDGWSLPQLFNQVMLGYQHAVNNTQTSLPSVPPAANYEDYIQWLNQRDQHQSNQFWQQQLNGFDNNDPFATLKLAQGSMAGEYILYDHALSVATTHKLQQLAKQNRCTMNVIVQAAWAYLVHRYSGFDDIVFGATVSGRPSELDNIEQMVGLFINSIPVRLQFNDKTTIKQLLDDLQQNNVRREEHSFVSLAQIQKQANLGKNHVSGALFESLIAFENYPLSSNNEDGSVEAKDDIIFEHIGSDEQTSFPLSLMAFVAKHADGEQLMVKFGFYQQQFDAALMQRLFGHLQQLLIALSEHGAEQHLDAWQLIPDAEYQSLVRPQHSLQTANDHSINQLFEQVATRQPQSIAISSNNQEFNYQAVELQANRLAHALLQAGAKKGEFIGIHLGRKAQFVIACLAVFKAGGAYVPLDPNYPSSRLEYIVNDAAIKLVISDNPIDNSFDWGERHIINIEQLAVQLPDTPPNLTLTGQDLAYMIYTSGTTGNPKGVMIEHGGFINSVQAQIEIIDFDHHARVLAYASWNFDASVIEIFDALLAGGTLVIADEQQVKSPELLTELMVLQQVSHATIPPAILPFLQPEQLPALKHLVVAGEHCPMSQVERWSASTTLYNGYGPTEASVCFSVKAYDGGELTLGQAIVNKQGYIVDKQLRIVPQGVAGELLIAGSGIARGYHNLPQQTAAAFIPNPFSDDDRLVYHSGDRVKQLENGDLLFLGRIDNQVKIRGHRIETAEIEAKLQQLPQVKAAAVTVKQDGEQGSKQLLAAIVPSQDAIAPAIELWPSVAEFYIYDDLLYRAMANDSRRVAAFKGAINAAVRDKVVLEVGPGNELLLTQMCITAGARKVYAVELMEQTYLTAKAKLAQLGKQDPSLLEKIVLIHGDATKVQLPELADYCVSGIVGSIGGSEGAAKIINEVRHQLKNPANMLPKRTVTNLAAITLDDQAFRLSDSPDAVKYGFSPIAAHYTQEVFKSLGKSFDLRVCLKHFKQSQMLSSIDVMESLDHSQWVALEDSHQMRLEINKTGIFHGFAAWLNLYTDDNHIMDILEADESLLPIYLPVSLEGIAVDKGDVITGTMERTLHSNGLNPNYRFNAQLHKGSGETIDVSFVTLHETDNFCASPFYQRLFNGELPNILPEQAKLDSLTLVQQQIAEQLPSYMVPSLFTELEALPVTPNGKVDYQALAALEVVAQQTDDYQPPSNDIETQLCEIWQQALNASCDNPVSVNDNFFAIGGDSIIAIGVVAKARSAGLNLSVADIFEYTTIARLAPIVAANQAASLAPQQCSEGEVALWPIAAHFFEQQLPDAHHFNQSVMVNTPVGFDAKALEAILKALIQRHDSLRLSFGQDNGRVLPFFMAMNDDSLNQFIAQCMVVETMPESRQQITQRCNQWQSQFNLSQGPLLRAILLQPADGTGEGKLCLILHHLIVDGVSWRILLSDLKLAWQQLRQDQAITLGVKSHSLQQWRQALNQYSQHIEPVEQDYWLAQLQKPVPQLQQLQQQQRLQQLHKNGQLQSCELSIDAEQTRQLIGPCNDAYLTRINELLLSALHLAWRQWCGETVLPLAMESHGRDDLNDHIDLSETVGWFTALYPQRLAVGIDSDIASTIDQIKTQYRELPNNGIGFGILKYIAKQPQIIEHSQPIACEVVFNYLGQLDQSLSDDGPFADAKLATGFNASPNQPMAQLLAINGMVTDGQLSFSLSFDDNRLALHDVTNLRDGFKQALLDLIDHCHNKIHNNQLFEQNSDLIVTDPNSMLDEGIEI